MNLDWSKLPCVDASPPIPTRPAVFIAAGTVTLRPTWRFWPKAVEHIFETGEGRYYDVQPWAPFGVPVFVRRDRLGGFVPLTRRMS